MKKRIQLVIDDKLLELIDGIVETSPLNRSEFITICCEQFFKNLAESIKAQPKEKEKN